MCYYFSKLSTVLVFIFNMPAEIYFLDCDLKDGRHVGRSCISKIGDTAAIAHSADEPIQALSSAYLSLDIPTQILNKLPVIDGWTGSSVRN